MQVWKKISLLFILWRIALLIPLVVAHFTLSYRKLYEYTLVTYFLKSYNPLNHFLVYPWGNFDGIYYLLIAAKGYTVNAGFFPLFPLLIHIVSMPFGELLAFDPLQYALAMLLVTLFFLVSLFLFYKLIRFDYTENIAIQSILFLLLFPTSFFFATIYSESLFLLLSLAAFYFARRKQWWLAGVAGGLLSATRIVGVMMLPALLYEYYKQEKGFKKRSFLSLLLIPLGLLGYVIYSAFKWGNPLYFIQAQGNMQNNRSVDSIVLFPQTILRYIKILLTVNPRQFEWSVALLEISSFLFAAALLYIAWKKRIRTSYILFAVLCLLVPASTGTFSGMPRYVVVIFPLFLVLALIKNKKIKIVYCSISALLLFLLFLFFSKGYFIA